MNEKVLINVKTFLRLNLCQEAVIRFKKHDSTGFDLKPLTV